MIEGKKLLSFASQIDNKTILQAEETASMPFIHPHVALMPDAHSGIGSAVGTVIPTKRAVIPAAVGVDIGCGMIALETQFTKADVDERMAATGHGFDTLRALIEREIPLSPGNYNGEVTRAHTRERIRDLEVRAEMDHVDLRHSPKWPEQLGSLGGGNHFIEGCYDERDHVWLFLHSGSRGVGNKIAQRHIKIARDLCAQWHITLPNKDLAYLPEGTDEFWQYIRDLHWAQKFALYNRAEMMDRYVTLFDEWMGAPIEEVQTINCHHNYTEPTTLHGEKVWLTRKGAINAEEGVMGVIPGSMGTRSYVVEGLGNKSGLYSAPHGAGRQYSRTKAKELFTEADLAAAMVGIEYRHGAEWIDEIPQAYKPIDVVMNDARELVKIHHELRQFVNVKGS
jgi:tRNA-splicing ligase RtcB